MLHILWILLKFILILLGILLGLILLVLLLILFCPVRYRAKASKETDSFKEGAAQGRISWLFGGIAFEVSYINGELEKELKIFGIRILRLLQKRQEKKERKEAEARVKEKKKSDSEKTSEKTASKLETADIKTEPEEKPQPKEKQERAERSQTSKVRRIFSVIVEKLRATLQKLASIPEKIKNFKLTADRFYAKIKWWKKFLTHPRTKEAIGLVKDKLLLLLKHISPTKIDGNVRFSCSDPANTGKILAITGMTIPLHKNCVTVTPLFEDRNMAMGNISLKGRIYGFVLVKTALQVYFNKNIKFVIKKWKKHKEVSYGR